MHNFLRKTYAQKRRTDVREEGVEIHPFNHLAHYYVVLGAIYLKFPQKYAVLLWPDRVQIQDSITAVLLWWFSQPYGQWRPFGSNFSNILDAYRHHY